MTTLTDEDLISLFREGESDRVEFKESMKGSAPDRIREAICAFANDLPGHGKPGMVFVGVRNDGTFADLTVTDELLLQLADMKTDGNIVPPPSMTVEKRTIHGSEVAVVIVQPSDSPPVRCRGRVHIRTGSRRDIATAQDERILNERRRYQDIPFDIQPIHSADLNDLDMLQFQHEYLPNAFAPDMLEANDRTPGEQLAAAKMIASPDQPTPTILGMLILGKRTLDYLPGAYVQFLKFDGREPTDPIYDESKISGSVTDVLRRLDDKLNSHNRTAVDIVSGPVERRTSAYPIAAIRQIVYNAVMHRSYEDNNAPVRVHWYDDRIEVISPGGVFSAVTPENFGRPGITAYRNPNLAEAMKNLGFVQRYGVGIPLAQKRMQEAGYPPIWFEADAHNVLATLRRAV